MNTANSAQNQNVNSSSSNSAMSPASTPYLMDLGHVGRSLSISRRMVALLVARGEMGSVKIGRRRLVPSEALAAYVRGLKA